MQAVLGRSPDDAAEPLLQADLVEQVEERAEGRDRLLQRPRRQQVVGQPAPAQPRDLLLRRGFTGKRRAHRVWSRRGWRARHRPGRSRSACAVASPRRRRPRVEAEAGLLVGAGADLDGSDAEGAVERLRGQVYVRTR